MFLNKACSFIMRVSETRKAEKSFNMIHAIIENVKVCSDQNYCILQQLQQLFQVT